MKKNELTDRQKEIYIEYGIPKDNVDYLDADMLREKFEHIATAMLLDTVDTFTGEGWVQTPEEKEIEEALDAIFTGKCPND